MIVRNSLLPLESWDINRWSPHPLPLATLMKITQILFNKASYRHESIIKSLLLPPTFGKYQLFITAMIVFINGSENNPHLKLMINCSFGNFVKC